MIREIGLEAGEVVSDGQRQVKATSVNHPCLGITLRIVSITFYAAKARVFIGSDTCIAQNEKEAHPSLKPTPNRGNIRGDRSTDMMRRGFLS